MSKLSRLVKVLLAVSLMAALYAATLVYANNKDFHSPYFDVALADNMNFISKTEEKDNGFYRYVFSSSKNEEADQVMRVIVSSKEPEKNQSLEAFETLSLGAMIAMFVDSYHLGDYVNSPENQKVFNGKPEKIVLGNTSFAVATLFFGDIEASFLITRAQNMTYAFTLVSKNSDPQIRKNNLNALTLQLQTLKFNAG